MDLYVGYSWEFGEGFSGDVALTRYIYPGTEEGYDYDYNEVIGTFGYNDMVFFTVGYSNDVFNSSETGIYYATQRQLRVAVLGTGADRRSRSLHVRQRHRLRRLHALRLRRRPLVWPALDQRQLGQLRRQRRRQLRRRRRCPLAGHDLARNQSVRFRQD
ncbi:MAG: hypothetical protein IPK97_17810, partial [Ahniella sp.]|nr:hypothetical protein [Ahniella sp.]